MMLVDQNSDKAIVLNNYFHSCFSTSQPPLDELPDCLELEIVLLIYSVLKTKYLTLWYHWISLNQRDQMEYLAKMLKGIAASIVYSLTKLFNQSISQGAFPSDWKIARIVPIPKNPE